MRQTLVESHYFSYQASILKHRCESVINNFTDVSRKQNMTTAVHKLPLKD